MNTITINPNCGNSPKMEFIKNFNIAFANGDLEFLANAVSDSVQWNIVGDRVITGKENFERELRTMHTQIVITLTINSIITHGKEGAASGVMEMSDGKKYAFSDHYTFSNAKGNKISAMTSFILEIS